MRPRPHLVLLLALGVVACADQGHRSHPSIVAERPVGALGASIARGEALVRRTPDSLPEYAPGRIACGSCHLDAGRDTAASPLLAAWTRYPRYLPRAGAVVPMTDRVNYCVTRSLAGRRLPADSRAMTDILAYLAWLSGGLPAQRRSTGGQPVGPVTANSADAPFLVGDAARGHPLYTAYCTACHGADGAGRGRPGADGIPALWGAASYAIGASMARETRAATFIQHNMPLGRPNTLTAQQAADVAAYVNAHERPDSPGKADDWPTSTPRDIPRDVPYTTRSGHIAYRPPPLLPRPDSEAARVPPPRATP